jgi:putative membrane protein
MVQGLNFTWSWHPLIFVALLLLCLLYAAACLRRGSVAAGRRRLAFAAALLLLALVFLTPLDTIARTQLFAAHMLQAVTLTTVCAPLLLYACSDEFLLPLLELPFARRPFLFLTSPLIASLLFNLTFLAWHIPGIFKRALANGALYHAELLSILLISLLNWWPLIGPLRSMRRMGYPMQMLYAFFDGQPVDIYAFLLVFTGTVLYTGYAIPRHFIAWGYTAVADQTIAGAFLLVPGLVDLVVMTPLFFSWLAQTEQRARIDDQRRQEAAAAAEAVRQAEEQAQTLDA